jgi:mRNA (guanine-N7-)-methyltransferase
MYSDYKSLKLKEEEDDDPINNYITSSNSNYKTNVVSSTSYYTGESVMRDPGKEGRKVSNIYFLRTFNNFIKASLISSVLRKLYLKECSVLDLCCGKGGDLDKFFQNNSKVYVGVDMSKEFIHIAKDRIIKIKNERKKINNCKCFLFEENVSDEHNHLMEKIPKYIYFDIVSCQMALHYHFATEKNLRAFMKNVVERLNFGGQFVATIIDDNTLIKRLRNSKEGNSNPLTFGNEFYSVKFENDKFLISKPYGIKYGFYLEDSIDKRGIDGEINYVEEYLVMFDNFIKICEEYDLYLEEKSNFHDYYQQLRQNDFYNNLFKRFIKGLDVDNYQKQWEIINLYQVIVFRKGKEKVIKYKSALNNFNNRIEKPDEIVIKTSEFA